MNKLRLNELNDETFKLNQSTPDSQKINEETPETKSAAAEATTEAVSKNDSKLMKRKCLKNLFALCVSYLVQFSAYDFLIVRPF